MSPSSNDSSNDGDDENSILRTALLRGTLSIKVTDVDLRRGSSSSSSSGTTCRDTINAERKDMSEKSTGALAKRLTPIETDYILQIESTNKVKFDDTISQKLSFTSQKVQKLETYCCSKQYVDIRNLANTLQDHAEELIKYYEEEHEIKRGNSAGSSPSTRDIGSGTKKSKKSYFSRGVEKLLAKPVEAAQFVTNTEPKSSHLVSELDKIHKSSGSKQQQQQTGSNTSSEGDGSRTILQRRASAGRLDELDTGAPPFVREVMLGIDAFYDAIYSEKRQFGHKKKTHYDRVKNVADRRKEIVNKAFEALTRSLARADLGRVDQYQGRVDLYSNMEVLIGKLEKFLVTDVVVALGCKGSVKDAMQVAAVEEAMEESMVKPETTRRRASLVDREAELEMVREVAADDMSSTRSLEVEGGGERHADVMGVVNAAGSESQSPSAKEEGETRAPIVTPTSPKRRGERDIRMPTDTAPKAIKAPVGILPDHPIDFAITVAVGAVLFKALEGRVMTVQLDLLVVFCIACGLVGYQIAVATTVVHVEHNCPPNGAFSYTPKGKTKETGGRAVDEPEHPPERRQRPSLLGNRSNGSLNVQQSRSKSLLLLRSSMKSTKGVFDKLQGNEAVPKEETPIVPAKTFAKFPDGAALGSHLNCWSSPPSNNFMVRGPNYLKDKKKVPSGDYLLPSRGCDLFLTDLAPVNLGRNRSLLEGRLRDVPTFIINYRLPWGVFLSYHEIPERFIPFLRRGNGHGDLDKPLPSTSNMPPGDRALCDFLLSDSHEKDAVWKIVPVVAQGPWMVKKVVGGKPAILGKQMPVSYVYQPPENGLAEYLEADLDIVSSAAARKILAVVRSYTQVLTVDLGFVVQGNRAEELPEQMMLGLRLHGLDPLTAELLPEFDDGSSMSDMDEDTGNDSD